MRTLIVPCAGSKKFNQFPIYLNRHPDGKLFAEKVLEGIYPFKYDRIIYVILATDEKFEASKLLEKEIGCKYNISICSLSSKTNGPAETIYKALQLKKVEGFFAVRDSTSFIELKTFESGNFIAGLDLTKFPDNVLNLRSKSFVISNKQNQVLDVIEKKFRSDIISVGLYGFESSKAYNFAFEHLNDKNYPINKLYISHIISYLIGYKNIIFHYVDAKLFEDWGSLEAFSTLQRKYATCLVNLDSLYHNSIEKLDDLMINNIFGKAKNTHLCFIMVTRNKLVDRRRIEFMFREAGINCTNVLLLESESPIRLVINNVDQLEKAIRGV
jgi:hypothetical protein